MHVHARPFETLASSPDPSTFSTGEQLLAIICFVYCGWMLAMSCRAWWADGREEKIKGSPQRQLMFYTSCVTILVLVPSIILGHLSPRIQGERVHPVWLVGSRPPCLGRVFASMAC